MGLRLAKSLFVLALVLYFLFLVIARIPASWGVWAVHQAVPQVRLTGITGTVWEGRAVGGTITLPNQKLPVENLQWDINPWALLGLNLCAEVQAQVLQQPASGTVCAAPGNVVKAKGVQLNAPMALVGDWFNLNLAGLGSLQVQTLRLDGQRVEELQGNFSWRDARVNAGGGWFSLGAFAAKLTANPQGGVHAEIFELDGPFKVQLAGDFLPGQMPTVKGTIIPSEQAPAAVSDALMFIGQPIEGGGFRVAWPPGS